MGGWKQVCCASPPNGRPIAFIGMRAGHMLIIIQLSTAAERMHFRRLHVREKDIFFRPSHARTDRQINIYSHDFVVQLCYISLGRRTLMD
jgi:hypothetical protein